MHLHAYQPPDDEPEPEPVYTQGEFPEWQNPPAMEHKPKKKRGRKKLPSFLRWPQAMTLLAWCEAQVKQFDGKMMRKSISAKRDEIVIRVGLYLGLRLAEITDLDISDVDFERRSVWVREGKGNKDRYVAMPTDLLPHLKAWIGARPSGVLIQGPGGRRMAPRTVRYRLERAAKLSGLSVHVHPHLLRHTCATRLLETGANIRDVQAILGHSDLATTSIYLDLDVTRLFDAVDRM